MLLLHNLKGSLKDGRLAIDEPACVEGAAAAVQCTPTTLKASPGPVTRRYFFFFYLFALLNLTFNLPKKYKCLYMQATSCSISEPGSYFSTKKCKESGEKDGPKEDVAVGLNCCRAVDT